MKKDVHYGYRDLLFLRYADDNCNGCEICAKVCPVNNIEMVDNRPMWKHYCETCLACFVWCPKKAIYGGLLRGKDERYHQNYKIC